ncbi:hypothetical protein GUJ93_ZPchr0002g23809 [Zizania palustris]|uniref:Uncharacterized protein n=1 Tax=Zizania palustris TaxID=103762 RepID=A0A8J5RID4_ZIZPA|nr:hypothetical protein GUJ93_ZPchr0002g23809 [Zizania palustris]
MAATEGEARGRLAAAGAPDLAAPAPDLDAAAMGAPDLAIGGRLAAAGALDLAAPAPDLAMAALDLVAAEAYRPPMVMASSPPAAEQSGGAAGKGEEEAADIMKVKTGADPERRGKEDPGTDDRGGSSAMEAVLPAVGERRGERGEPRALIPCRKG